MFTTKPVHGTNHFQFLSYLEHFTKIRYAAAGCWIISGYFAWPGSKAMEQFVFCGGHDFLEENDS